jgi:hypothetical protein
MSIGAIYGKTSLGMHEMSSRKLKLSPRLRTMLILVDGHQPAFILQEEAEKVGAPDDFLDQLVNMQLIEKVGTANQQTVETAEKAPEPLAIGGDEFTRFRAAKDLMNVTVVDALGIRSFFFTLKLERAGNIADLRELVSGYREAIAKGSGADEAQVFTERLKLMLR